MIRLLLISGLICLSGFVTSTNAQVYTFYFDTTASSSVSSSADSTAGHGMAEIEITIAGNELTAIIRNTSPDAQNAGADMSSPAIGMSSPAIVGWGVDLEADAGPLGPSYVIPLSQRSSFTVFDGNGDSVIDNWKVDPEASPYVLSFQDEDGLYNPEATEGLVMSDPAGTYFTGDSTGNTGAVFSGAFFASGTIQLVERTPGTFSTFVRFGYVGSDGKAQFVDTLGSPPSPDNVVRPAHSPEPSSLLIWALGIALCVGVHRRWRPKTTL